MSGEIDTDEALRWLMGQAQGRAVLKHLLASGGYEHADFDRNNSQLSYLTGRRAVVAELLVRIKSASPDAYRNYIGDLLQ